MPSPSSNVAHLYVHVPFCAAKCKYCAFYSAAAATSKMGDYLDAVTLELARCAPQLAPTTIFFGGGTPSLLPISLLRPLLDAVGRTRCPSAPLEWTIECNPATVSAEKAQLFRAAGVNRISLGVQALDDAMLAVLGRIHSAASAGRSYELLRAAGFANINLDLMFGLPGQTVEHWRETLRRAIALQPEHLSTYCLILEEDTEFWSLFQQGLLKPDAEAERVMYETAIEMLAAAGYHQYEISNFAKPGRECAHNLAYWEGKDYIGLGPSACSTVGTRRWQNISDTDRYIAAWRASLPASQTQPARREPCPPALDYEETISPELRAAECAAFGMRMNAGVPGELVRGRWDEQIAGLLSADLVQWRNGRLQPTKRGILFADEVAAEFV